MVFLVREETLFSIYHSPMIKLHSFVDRIIVVPERAINNKLVPTILCARAVPLNSKRLATPNLRKILGEDGNSTTFFIYLTGQTGGTVCFECEEIAIDLGRQGVMEKDGWRDSFFSAWIFAIKAHNDA
jgi:hypothetical protein